MTDQKIHTDTVEFGLAEFMWANAADDRAKLRAIEMYETACNKNDGAAFLALYKINIEFRNLELQLGDRLRLNLKYLRESLNLGFLPAFLYAGKLDTFTAYERLVYLSIGMFCSNRENSSRISDFQSEFASLSSTFAPEFITEILEFGEKWSHGVSIHVKVSRLEDCLIQHPEKYDLESDITRDGWHIFEDCSSTEIYLQLLPGAEHYFKACESEEIEDMVQWKHHMEIAESKGNGQAIYALRDRREKKNLFSAAQTGSIDAFMDLINDLNDYFEQYQYSSSQDYDFYNTTRIEIEDVEKFLSAINCFLYLYSIMQRLGIGKYCNSSIQVARLTTKTDSGYQFWSHATASELKYELCSHKLACQMNDRSFSWKLGDKFDAIFYENFYIATKNLD